MLKKLAESEFIKRLKEGIVSIDNSEYITWNSCFANGIYYGGLRRVSARSRAPLAFGGAVHAGMQALLLNFGKLSSTEIFDEVLKAAYADAATTSLDNLGDNRRNTTRLEELLRAYVLEYIRVPGMRFDVITLDGERMVEKSFSVPFGNLALFTTSWGKVDLTIMWTGKIDVLSFYSGAVAPVDHKTTTVMGEKFVDDKVRSSQFLGYSYAARYLSTQLFKSLPVFGTRINALAMRSAGFEFKTFDIPFPDWKVAEWQLETIQAIKQLITQLDHALVTGEVVPTRDHCVTKYGKCQYFDMCDMHPTSRDRMLFDDSYFFESQWSPLNE